MNGHVGKILRVDLTHRKISVIPTQKYAQWVGGHGMGSAIFFDLVKDKTIDGFHPENVVTLMTSPLCGTPVPAGAGRTEVQGIGVQSYPKGWFTLSNFGGRFSTMLKMAGWDGIVISGRASEPVWVDIRDDSVAIVDCKGLGLWGTDTRVCQERIWKYVAGGENYGDWRASGDAEGALTTQRPAVLAVGQAGENLSRVACLMHDAGHSSGQGGFGAVWGAKQLKAISVIGTGGIKIHDPQGLMRARLAQVQAFAFDHDGNKPPMAITDFEAAPLPVTFWGAPPRSARPLEGQRPVSCIGCHAGCRARYESGKANEAHCVVTLFYTEAHTFDIQRRATELLNTYGLNAFEMISGVKYLRALHKKGVLGPGRTIDFPISFEDYGSAEFLERFLKMMTYGDDGTGRPHPAGAALLNGFVRAAETWGRLEEDSRTGLLEFPYWGCPIHYDPRVQLEWGYGSILGDRDINEHGFNTIYYDATYSHRWGGQGRATAEETVRIYTDKMAPFQDDPFMLDYSDKGMYSEHMARLVAWHRRYTRFWKHALLFCDFRWPDFINVNREDKKGSTGQSEPHFFTMVTGKKISFSDGIELGRKIWNLDQAIWTLQGRHRDMVHFAEYIYALPYKDACYMPGRKEKKWEFMNISGRCIDKEKFEAFKTRYYELEGWDPASGYPTRKTLTGLGLDHVADELASKGRLGQDHSKGAA